MSYLAYEPIEEELTLKRTGPTARVKVIVPTKAEAELYGLQCIGGYRSNFGSLTYFTPAIYSSTSLLLYCNDVKIEPIEGFYNLNDPSDWGETYVTLSFGMLDQPDDQQQQQQGNPTQIADFSYEISGQELILPKEELTFGGSEENNDDHPNPIKIIPEGTLTASFAFKPHLDPAKWSTYVGKVNSATFQGHEPESVMFNGVGSKRTVTSDGKTAHSFDLKFSAKYGTTWNKSWNARLSEWQAIEPKTYQTANFKTLIDNF